MSNRGFDVLCVLSALGVVPWVVSGSLLALAWAAGSCTFFFAARTAAQQADPVASLALRLVCAGAIGVLTFSLFLGFLWPSAHTLIAGAIVLPFLISIFGVFRPESFAARPALLALVCASVALSIFGQWMQLVWLLLV